MFHSLPQSNFLNPAITAPCKGFAGVPLLSSIHVGYNNSFFNYNDVIVKGTNGSIYPNIKYFLRKSDIGKKEYLRSEAEISIVHFGFRYKKNYSLFFLLRDKLDAGLFYPINLIQLAFLGNTTHIGREYRMDGLLAFGIYYREWGIGISKVINKQLHVGLRGHILFGKANFHTFNNKLSLYTNDDIYQLRFISDVNLKVSPLILETNRLNQISDVQLPQTSITKHILNSKNKGISFHAGLLYLYSKNIAIEASILDVGFIYWKYYPIHIREQTNFYYNGFYYDPETQNYEDINNTVDSILNSYSIYTQNKGYITAISPKMYLGLRYNIYSWLTLGIIQRNEWYHTKIQTSLSMMGYATYKNCLAGSLSYTLIHGNLLNFGIGFSCKLSLINFYAISDNLYGIFKYKSMHYSNVRIGINIVWGCHKNYKEAQPLCPSYKIPVIDYKKYKK